jgi:FkbM family methyltransferase
MKKQASDFIFTVHQRLFVKKRFYKLNRLLYTLSLRGLGILNYQNHQISGEQHFLYDYLTNKQSVLVFDVGANRGRYANTVKQLCQKAEIYAFEPHPKTFEYLRSIASQYGYTALNLACGSSMGQATLYDYAEEKEGSTHASMHKNVIEQIHKGDAAAWKVSVITLDQFIKEKAINRIHLLKIDAEGNELDILKGAKNSINAGIIDAIHFEFNEMNVVSRVFFKDFYEILPNYKFFRMLPDGLIPLKSYSPLECEIFAYQNVVALRHE